MKAAANLVFVTGTDTGAGKTLLTALLLWRWRQGGCHALATKPFASGSRADARLFDKLQDQELPVELLSPFFFAAPLAPLVAGRSLGQVVTRSAALARLREAGRRCELLLVEGCGGVLAPLGPGYFLVDLMAAFAAPAIITARNRLGVINHSLLSVKALREAGVQPALLMLMGCAKPDESASSNPALLRELLDPVPVFSMPFLGPKAASFRGVQEHAKKQKKRLADAAAAVKLTLSSGENRRAQRGRKFFEESC